MHRIVLAGSFVSLGLWLGLPAASRAQAQDRAGAAMAGQAVQQPPPPAGAAPPPAGAVQPAVPGGPGGGVVPPPVIPPGAGRGAGVVGNLGIGTIPVTPPPPIGYYAPARPANYNVGKFYYYPYYYYPHSYWPTESCQWPERPGEPYMRPPAYMAYPPFLEPHWRYEWNTPQKYYRGFHFWLDQF